MIPQTVIASRGLVLILSSPSGAGKTTLTRRLAEDPSCGLGLSISVTTRPRRPSEIDGVHYHFIGKDTFTTMRETGALIESAQVHGNFYGTPRAPVEASLAGGRDMIFDIDWQGTRQIVAKMREDVVTVFILPPSMTELKARLEKRAEDAGDVIARRLDNARGEIERWVDYDYVLVNSDFNATLGELMVILKAERLRRTRRTGLSAFVAGLLADGLA